MFISLQASVILSLLLSGCLVSRTPLITAGNSDRPFPAHSILTFDDKPEKASLDLGDDNSYIISALSTGDNKDIFEDKMYFKKISDDTFAYSRREIDKETGKINHYAYGYMRLIDSNRITTHEPDCTDFDPAELQKLGVEIIKPKADDFAPAYCVIPSVEALEALLRSFLNDPKNAEKIKPSDDSIMRITPK